MNNKEEKLATELKHLETLLNIEKASNQQLLSELEELKEKYEKLNQKYERLVFRSRSLRKKLSIYRQKIKELKENTERKKEVPQEETKEEIVNKLIEEISNLKEIITSYDEKLNKLESIIKEIKSENNKETEKNNQEESSIEKNNEEENVLKKLEKAGKINIIIGKYIPNSGSSQPEKKPEDEIDSLKEEILKAVKEVLEKKNSKEVVEVSKSKKETEKQDNRKKFKININLNIKRKTRKSKDKTAYPNETQKEYQPNTSNLPKSFSQENLPIQKALKNISQKSSPIKIEIPENIEDIINKYTELIKNYQIPQLNFSNLFPKNSSTDTKSPSIDTQSFQSPSEDIKLYKDQDQAKTKDTDNTNLSEKEQATNKSASISTPESKNTPSLKQSSEKKKIKKRKEEKKEDEEETVEWEKDPSIKDEEEPEGKVYGYLKGEYFTLAHLPNIKKIELNKLPLFTSPERIPPPVDISPKIKKTYSRRRKRNIEIRVGILDSL